MSTDELDALLTDTAVDYALDYFAYILLEHPMMQANISLSAEAATLLRRVALYLDLPIHADRDPDLAALERHPLSQLRTSKLKRQPAHAFVLLNPELLSMPDLHAKYFATRPDMPGLSWINATRSEARRVVATADKQPKHRGRTMRPRPEPIDPDTGLYYHESSSAVNPLVLRHSASPYYLFHAWAWGRRRYAQHLIRHGRNRCVYNPDLSVLELERHNPPDGSGPIYLELAYRYAIAFRGRYLVLPVPLEDCTANELRGEFQDISIPGVPRDQFIYAVLTEAEPHGVLDDIQRPRRRGRSRKNQLRPLSAVTVVTEPDAVIAEPATADEIQAALTAGLPDPT